MMLSQQILDLLSKEPNLNANEIADKLSQKKNSVKVVLQRMAKRNRIVRERKETDVKPKCGPRNIFLYKLAEQSPE